MSWERILKDNKEFANAIQKFVDDMMGIHLEMIKIWSELKENIPEEDKPRYEELIEEFGQAILVVGKMPGDLIHYYNAVDSGNFSEDSQ